MNKQKTPLCSNKTALVLALGLMASLGLNQTALAADLYAGVMFGSGTADQNVKSELENLGNTVEIEDSGTVFSVFGGENILTNAEGVNLDIEGFYTSFGDLVSGSYSQTGLEGKFSGSGSTFGVAAVPSFKMGDVNIFGKLGLHRYSSEFNFKYTNSSGTSSSTGEATGFSYVFGAGAKYAINKNFSLVATAEQYKLGVDAILSGSTQTISLLDGVTVLSAGVQANF